MPYKDPDKKRECDRKSKQRWIQRNLEEHRRRSRESMRDYYAANPEKVKKRNIWQKSKFNQWWKEYKSNLKCIRCGETHSACLEFHHRNPAEKEMKISEYAQGGWASKRKLLDEIAKCDVLCANCHRKEHYKNNGEQ